MTIKKIFNYFNYTTLTKYVNRYLLLKFKNKKRIILSNSHQSDRLLHKFFKKSLDFEKIREIFFNIDLFPYSVNSEKERIIQILKNDFEEESKKYIEIADKIINKEFYVFEKYHKFDNVIHWQFSFFNHYYWPLKKSHKIDIRPKGIEVDVKYVWEFNRHQFFPFLGYAYYVTRDEKYAFEFEEQVLDWIMKNPPLYGINWNSALEISLRLISWIFSLYFFKDSSEINNRSFFEKIFKSMFQHVFFLRYFYTRRKFNHTVGELFGIYLFCKIFNSISSIKKWEKKFYRKFKSQIILQTRTDGVNVEQSVNYHREVLAYFSLFLSLNPRINKDEKDLIEKMYDYLLYLIKPNGKFPLIGDSDNGRVLILNYYNGNPFSQLINLGTILFRRDDLKFIVEKLYPSALLLTGIKGWETFNSLHSQEPEKKCKYFKNSGYITIRSNWDVDSNYLFYDFAKFGHNNAGHTHSSATNFVISFQGKDIIVDSGTYTYNKSYKERNYFRSSKAHNLLTINQKNQAKAISWFEWENPPHIYRKIEIKDDIIKLICTHMGYKEFIVKRELITNKKLNYLIIKDIILKKLGKVDESLHDIDIYFHFNKDTTLLVKDNNVIINDLLVMNISSKERFTVNIKKTFYSPQYGFKYESSLVNIHLNHSFENIKGIEVITKINPLI